MSVGPATNNRTPRFTVTVAGQTVTQADPKGLESISVEDHVDMIGVCELSFTRGSSASGIQWASLTVGAVVEVVFGGDTRPVFKGKITAIRHGSNRGRHVAVVQAMDPLIQLSMSRRTKSFERMKDSDAANDAISASGGTPGRVDATTETRAHIHQRNESNLTFIRRLAARNGYLVYCNEGKVDFAKLQSSATALSIPAAEMISLDYDMSPKSIPPSITVYGWDYVNKQRVEGRATPSDVELIGGGQSSAENRGDIWGQDAFISDVWVDSQSAAKEHAVAEYNRLARSFMRGSGTMQCNGSLHVGVKVRFEEHRTGFNPEAFVMSSRHRVYVGGGATTEITFCSNTREATATGGGESGAGVGSALASGTPMP
ncbi:MAG: phage late control D family protein, partial [Deltaproteobacteria bacterium]|nr:phage late control D family protein [Deltaproteobacteria bacterium]